MPDPLKSIKVTVLGAPKSGKTQLLNTLMGEAFSDRYLAPIGVQRNVYATKKDVFTCYETYSHDPFFSALPLRDANIVLICVDLSQDKPYLLDLLQMKEEALKVSPNAQILVVPTKADALDAQSKFESLKKHASALDFKLAPTPTSAKTGDGLAELQTQLNQIALETDHQNQSDLFHQQVKELEVELQNMGLSESKQEDILEAINNLKQALYQFKGQLDLQEKALNHFLNTCNSILNRKEQKALKAVKCFSAFVLSTLFVAGVGFGICATAGAGAVPALFVGLASGKAHSVAVASTAAAVGFFSGSNAAHQTQKPSESVRRAKKALEDFEGPKKKI